MFFDIPPNLAGVVFQLPPHGVKGITNRHIRIFMGLVIFGRPADYQLAPGDGDIQPDAIKITLVMALMQCLDDHPAAHDMLIKLIQLLCPRPNIRFQSIGLFDMPKTDLKRYLHLTFSLELVCPSELWRSYEMVFTHLVGSRQPGIRVFPV
jgi:hypothetical protein